MIINKNFEEIEKEAKMNLKGYFKTNAVVVTTVVTGASMYLLGRSKAMKLGYSRGRLEGYAQAVSDIANMMRDAKSTGKE